MLPYNRAIEELRTYAGPAQRLVNILFGTAEPLQHIPQTSIELSNPNLNEGQRATVLWTLAQRDIAIIHGPPGTGKTTTVAEVIVQLAKQGAHVLACAPSNTAVDNLVERLVSYGVRCVRVGHPARMADSVVRVRRAVCNFNLEVMHVENIIDEIQYIREDVDTCNSHSTVTHALVIFPFHTIHSYVATVALAGLSVISKRRVADSC